MWDPHIYTGNPLPSQYCCIHHDRASIVRIGFEQSYREGTDDVGFSAALLDRLDQAYRIDRQRVFATGLTRVNLAEPLVMSRRYGARVRSQLG